MQILTITSDVFDVALYGYVNKVVLPRLLINAVCILIMSVGVNGRLFVAVWSVCRLASNRAEAKDSQERTSKMADH